QAASSRAAPSTNSSNSVGSSPSLPAANSWCLGPQKNAESARPANRRKRSERAAGRRGREPVRPKTSQPRDDPCSGLPPPPAVRRGRRAGYQWAMLRRKRKIALAGMLNGATGGTGALAGRQSRVVVRRRDVNWELGLNEGVDFEIYPGLYQRIPPRAARLITPGALVLDIGANIGAHSLPLARAVGNDGLVIAVEPTDYAFSRLQANAALNSELVSRLVLVQAALTAGTDRPERKENAHFYSRWPLKRGGGGRHAKHLGALEAATGACFLTVDGLL